MAHSAKSTRLLTGLTGSTGFVLVFQFQEETEKPKEKFCKSFIL